MSGYNDTDFPHLRRTGDGIYQSEQLIVKFSTDEIKFLKSEAKSSIKKRARICAHRNGDDLLHEMIIVICAGSYIHPHRHHGKSESFHIIEGEVDVVIFTDKGEVEEVVELGDLSTGKKFFYRLDYPKFHTLIIHSELLVVHEVTNGPFSRELTELAPFAPSEENIIKVDEYMNNLRKRVCGSG